MAPASDAKIPAKLEDQSYAQSYNLPDSFTVKEEFHNIKVEFDCFDETWHIWLSSENWSRLFSLWELSQHQVYTSY